MKCSDIDSQKMQLEFIRGQDFAIKLFPINVRMEMMIKFLDKSLVTDLHPLTENVPSGHPRCRI